MSRPAAPRGDRTPSRRTPDSRQREARQKITPIGETGVLERAGVAGALEQLQIDLQLDRRRPPHAGAIGLEYGLAERQLDAVKHAPQSRAAGLAGAFRPQQGGDDVPRNRALGLCEVDQQRKALAQVQLDRAVVAMDLRKRECPKREGSHEIHLDVPRARPRGRARGRLGDGRMLAGHG